MRVRRAADVRIRPADGLTSAQWMSLVQGAEFKGERPFDDEEHMRRVYFRHRAWLLRECRPFERPEAFWNFEGPPELGGVPPDCPRNGRMSQREALLKFGMELTPEERAILQSEGFADVCKN